MLYQSFMSLGKVPNDWKTAHIKPLSKKGDSSDFSNNCSVSLTSVFCKLMECMVISCLLDYLHMHRLISKQQHRFLSKRSTATNLMKSLNDWMISFENGWWQTVAYVDFAKAFDRVCHNKLSINQSINQFILSHTNAVSSSNKISNTFRLCVTGSTQGAYALHTRATHVQ